MSGCDCVQEAEAADIKRVSVCLQRLCGQSDNRWGAAWHKKKPDLSKVGLDKADYSLYLITQFGRNSTSILSVYEYGLTGRSRYV
jgi:hypothetical protein